MLLKDLEYLKIDLPEDVLKIKMNGNFAEAVKLINLRLNKKITFAMRKRLELEKEIINTIKNEYPYTFDDALKLCQDKIKDFTSEELIFLQEDSQADWILVDGQIKFNDSFYGSLLFTRADLRERLIDQAGWSNERAEFLSENIRDMIEEKEASYHIHMKTSLKIKDECACIGKKVRVHMPVPATCQQSNIKIIKTTPEAAYIADENHSSRTACFETVLQENMEFSVEYSYESHLKYNNPDPSVISAQQPDYYTNEFEPHIMFTPYIRELAGEIIGEETNPLINARKIYDYITQNIKYSYVRSYSAITNIPEYAALNLKGDCGVQALLFITLCRYAGIPAKWQSGLAVTPYHIGPHDWAQFYIEPYGWLYADPSFGGDGFRIGNTEKWNFYFGNLEPFRMVANSEFQHEFDPPKQYSRHDPYDNQVGECEYEDREIRREEFRVKFELIDMKKI